MRVNGILSLLSLCDVCRLSINLLGAMMARFNNRSRIASFVEEIYYKQPIRFLVVKVSGM